MEMPILHLAQIYGGKLSRVIVEWHNNIQWHEELENDGYIC